MSSDEKKIEVLKKAVLKLQNRTGTLEEENEQLKQKLAAAEKAHEATRTGARENTDELEILKYNNVTLGRRVTALQDELQKAKQDKGWAPLTGLKDMVSGKKTDDDREVIVEELQHKIKESEQLHARIFDMQRELDDARHQRDLLEGRYGTETMGAVARISELEEELRLVQAEEKRLNQIIAERNESHTELQAQHRALLDRVREMQTRLTASMDIGRNVLTDTLRVPDLAELDLSFHDRQRTAALSESLGQLSATVGNMVRDVEALFANATERIHILLSKATATEGPVQIAALRMLKDSLRKANAGHADVSKKLLSRIEAITVSKAQQTLILQRVAEGDVPPALDAATTVTATAEGVEWTRFLADNVRHVLVALFAHSPVAGEEDDQAEEITRLQSAVGAPLESFGTGMSVTPAALRQLKGSLKELTEAVTSLFAREVKVAWELTGFDGVNKRIAAVLKALHTHILTAVELRGSILKETEQDADLRQVRILPPKDLLSEEERAVLPETYLEHPAPYHDAGMARVRMHRRTAAFMQRISQIPLEVDLVPRDEVEEALQQEGSDSNNDIGDDTAAQHCSLLEVVPTPPSPALVHPASPPGLSASCQSSHQRELDAYKHALLTADSKAVEYRIEWQRTLFNLEAHAETSQGLEDENRDLKRRLRNRDMEVKNMSHGYTDQMKVFQDRILDLENRLAAASSGRR